LIAAILKAFYYKLGALFAKGVHEAATTVSFGGAILRKHHEFVPSPSVKLSIMEPIEE